MLSVGLFLWLVAVGWWILCLIDNAQELQEDDS